MTNLHKARAAREDLRYEIRRLSSDIKTVDAEIVGSNYLSRDKALYRNKLKNKATVLAMACALFNSRLHSRRIVINGSVWKFKDLADQWLFLGAVCTDIYGVLNSFERKRVSSICDHYSATSDTANARFVAHENSKRTKRKIKWAATHSATTTTNGKAAATPSYARDLLKTWLQEDNQADGYSPAGEV